MMTSQTKSILLFAGKKSNQTKHSDLTNFGNNGAITGVKVLWADSIIGLELIFGKQSTGVIRGSKSDIVFEDQVNLVQGDYIIEIFGRHSDVINCLGFKTKKGYNRTWGCPLIGESFSFIQQNSYIKSVKVDTQNYLNAIEPVYENEMFLTAKLVNLNLNAKITDRLGKRNNQTIEFDDEDFVKGKFNYRINSVKVWHDGRFVYGFQTTYDMDGTNKSPGMHISMGNNLKCDQLSLNEGEHIVKILVRAGDSIDKLIFFTDQGKMLECGGNGGNPYLLVPPNGHHFVSFSGGNGNILDLFSAHYDEIY